MNLFARVPFRRKSKFFDFSQIVEEMADDLEELHRHVVKHCYHESQDEKAAEILRAANMLRAAVAESVTDEEVAALYRGDSANSCVAVHERWEREWNDAWDYIRDNMRKWWC